MKLHPLNTLSADESGKFWLFTFIYSQDKLEAFAATLETMSKNISERAMGVAFMASPPPAFEPRFIVTTQFFGTETAARSALAPFFSIDPVVVQKHITFDQISDSSDQLDAKGGYKYITSTGMRTFHAEKLLNAFKYGLDMLVKHPELKKSILGTTFFNPGVMARVPDESTAWGHRDIVGWAMAVPFTDDAASFPLAEKYAEDFLEYLHESEKIASFPNHTRSRGAHERYPGEWRVKKLQRLKQEWDPAGVFPLDFHSSNFADQ
ncbi:hypothetical protein Plec18167_009311 [Paecilomyces lecythidis]|uniref:Berberine/berberine-like domain-containing protein n=1 Tax=Paecilomyces lecythidis TaxID=3004212 RepID=A0ABR3WQU4_9EURO